MQELIDASPLEKMMESLIFQKKHQEDLIILPKDHFRINLKTPTIPHIFGKTSPRYYDDFQNLACLSALSPENEALVAYNDTSEKYHPNISPRKEFLNQGCLLVGDAIISILKNIPLNEYSFYFLEGENLTITSVKNTIQNFLKYLQKQLFSCQSFQVKRYIDNVQIYNTQIPTPSGFGITYIFELQKYANIQAIFKTLPISVTQIAYDGENFYMSPLCYFSLRYNFIPFDMKNNLSSFPDICHFRDYFNIYPYNYLVSPDEYLMLKVEKIMLKESREKNKNLGNPGSEKKDDKNGEKKDDKNIEKNIGNVGNLKLTPLMRYIDKFARNVKVESRGEQDLLAKTISIDRLSDEAHFAKLFQKIELYPMANIEVILYRILSHNNINLKKIYDILGEDLYFEYVILKVKNEEKLKEFISLNLEDIYHDLEDELEDMKFEFQLIE